MSLRVAGAMRSSKEVGRSKPAISSMQPASPYQKVAIRALLFQTNLGQGTELNGILSYRRVALTKTEKKKQQTSHVQFPQILSETWKGSPEVWTLWGLHVPWQ